MLVLVHSTYSWPEAEAVTAMLNAYGLEAMLADRHMIATDWPAAMTAGGFRIMVPEQHRRGAEQLVAEFKAETP
jgi:hypothetical protein